MGIVKTSVGEKVFNKLNYLTMSVFTLLCIYPFYYVIIYSISDPTEASVKGVILLPLKLSFYTYTSIFQRGDLLNASLISVSRTVLGTLLTVVCSSMLAYLVTKKEMIGRRFVYRLVIITMYLNVGLIPWYIAMKSYGLKNSFLLYIIPGMVNAFYVILVKTFIEQLPASMEESASMDGAGFFQIFFRIIIPLSKPIIATISVYSAVSAWNTWTDNYFLANNPHLQTVQMILYNYLRNAQDVAMSMRNNLNVPGTFKAPVITPQSVQMTIIVISVVPILMVYPFLQKHFAKGIMFGAIKG
ncbi:MAG: carbohydrate ABC transporter permease [Ruminiclostridium sp.]|nr:carbohydrate ABC transporter permease [Ruminiclostridium sp.]